MNEAYLFKIGVVSFILNIQQSSIGYSYPRIFVRFADDSCLNYDLTIGSCFKMSANDWDSWLDGTEQRLDTIEEVENLCGRVGLNWGAFEDFAFQLNDEANSSL